MVDNVVYLYRDQLGTLAKVENIPLPGTLEWIRDISRTFARIGLVDEDIVELVVTNLTDDKLDEFMCRMLGNLTDLFSADPTEYVERGREQFNSTPLPEEDQAFFINLIYDLGRILYLEPTLIKKHVDKLLKGHLCTFFMANVMSFVKIIEPKTKDSQS